MADNFSFTEGSGKTGAADEIGGVLYPRVKIAQGADGIATDVSSAAPLQVSLANHAANATAVKVDGSAVTQPVSGTFYQATQPVSAASLPLPIGAATEATLAGVLTTTDFDTKTGSLTETAPASDTASSGLNGRLQRIAQRLTSLIALLPAALTGSGNLKVSLQESNASQAVTGTFWQATQPVSIATAPVLVAGSAVIGKVGIDQTTPGTTNGVQVNAALPAGTNAIGKLAANSGVDIGDVDVTTVGTITPGTAAANLGKAEDAVAGSGDVGVMALAVRADTAASTAANGDYVPLLTDSVGALHTRDTASLVDDASFTPGTSRVIPIGLQADETSTDSVDEGDIGAPRITLDRKQIVTEQPHTAGGLSMSKTVSAASTNATSLKASAGKIYSIQASNVNAAARYLKLYNKSSAPTVGTDTPVKTLIIPGNTAGAGTNIVFPTGIEFATGIAFALTTEATDAGTTGVAASEIVVNIDYK